MLAMKFWKIWTSLVAAAGVACAVIFLPGVFPERGDESEPIAPSAIKTNPGVDRAADFALSSLIQSLPTDKSDEIDFALGSGRDVIASAGEAIKKTRERGGLQCVDGVFRGSLEKGQSMASILENAASGNLKRFLNEANRIVPLRSFRAGQPYAITIDPATGRIKRFEYEINGLKRLVVEGETNPRGRVEDIDFDLRLETASGTIDDNLFQAVADIGESPNLAIRLVKLFGSEINFSKHLQAGDSFSILIEKRYRDGEFKGYGRALAATFVNGKKLCEAFLFCDEAGEPQYYNRSGENLHKAFLQSPLAVTRLTSRFSQRRFHPVLGRHRPHLGVDYGAPTGTPVKSVGDGSVVSRGWAGGYGNQIVVRHAGGVESWYSHLSGFSRGLRPGQKVKQGQVIGFVGSTGLSTGPHLDFRLRRNNVFVDPEKNINPRGAPVAAAMLKEFNRIRDLEEAYLKGEKIAIDYSPALFAPAKIASAAEKTRSDLAKSPRAVVKKKKSARKTETRRARRRASNKRG